MGLLMIEIDNSNFKIYDSQMIDFIMDKTIVDYLKFIQFCPQRQAGVHQPARGNQDL